MNKTMKTLGIVSSVLLLLLSAGCATIEGAGKDIEAAGEAVQDAADNE
ncbi:MULTISPECIES: entericidin A/B family lipoprotein [Alteromonadaceae]|jgi:predicted small secreted protein|uniref:Entericidin A/B family lipoprotein n=1 Tax=Brumicola blandensis TaxID=3075611 RepID=A0AAW8R583_9ALTE|nr:MULTISPECIES: entericidin A/B family lipoprotein [unclassified Alteromonas]MDT0583604.1 entericidin A/B family lipoprotein [Alteromonas sp. W409]MDT0629271.1 entericidin A/B family lipoprotein [Alteromonas sp. W364]